MSISWLELGHTQKLGMKCNKRKAELQQRENNVGNKIERKLKKELINAKSVINAQLYNRVSFEYNV